MLTNSIKTYLSVRRASLSGKSNCHVSGVSHGNRRTTSKRILKKLFTVATWSELFP